MAVVPYDATITTVLWANANCQLRLTYFTGYDFPSFGDKMNVTVLPDLKCSFFGNVITFESEGLNT